ncbi:bcl-2-like protein 15 [Scleropages formosus]|uniref:bcl-2-like protein 15 n=1 Tax=Scleropages formosus TaxID=113540 RepID=UPI000878768C|nr:bcl-2-like protein 15 [Scleropages formosus]
MWSLCRKKRSHSHAFTLRTTMAPRDVTAQTFMIVQCLLEEPGVTTYKGLNCDYETDAADEDSFDPTVIADKLRELGDDYDAKVIQPLIKNIGKAARDQVVEAFADSVTKLCESRGVAELDPEKCLLKASVQLGLCVAKKCPELRAVVEYAMANFLNIRLASWVEAQGGWEEVCSH